MSSGASDRERALIEAAWSQYEDLAERSASGARSSESFLAPSTSGVKRTRPVAFPGFRVMNEIHRGGQGVVFLAVQESTGRRVAIKMLRHGPMAGIAERARFEREIELLARLRHPNIVAIHDRGWTDDGAYYVMDYVAGMSLQKHLDDPTVSVRDIARVFCKVADAVSAAHMLGVIHRDLKPSNIRVDDRGEPRVLDFGLARLAVEAGDETPEITQTGQFVGSLPWASPEQAQGDGGAIDVRTDVYSLGVMLFEALTGEFPYPVHGGSRMTVRHIVDTPPTRPRRLRPKLDDEIETITLKCLSKEPGRRYQSAGELARDLERYVRGEAIEAKRESTWYVVRKLAWRHRAAASLGMLALALLVAGVVVSGVLYARAEAARRLADSRYEQSRLKGEQTRKTLQFLEDIFGSVSPYVAAGSDTSVLEHMLADARRRAASDLDGQIEVRAAVHDMLGMSLAMLYEYDAAREELQEGLRLRRERFGDQSEPVVESLLHLATVDHDEGMYDAALERCAEVSRLLAAMPNAPEELTAQRLHVEASVALSRGDFALALTHTTGAVEIRRRTLEASDQRLLRSLKDLASALRTNGRFDEAERILQQLLAEQTEHNGPVHPYVQHVLMALGELEMERSQPARAQEYLERSLAICRDVYPRVHLTTASALNTLGALMNTTNRHAQALAYSEESLAMRRQVIGDEAPGNAATLVNIGAALKNLGRLDEAEQRYDEALRLLRKGGSRRILATTLNNVAALHKARGDHEASARLDQEALDLRRQLFPGHHPDVAQSLNNLAVSVSALGRHEEAEALFRECLTMQLALFGETSRLAALTGVNLSENLLAREPRNIEAFTLIQRSVSVLEASPVPEGAWLVRARYILGCALAAHGHEEDAERMLLMCDDMIQRGVPSTIARDLVASRLVKVYEKMGRDDQAARWRGKLKSPP